MALPTLQGKDRKQSLMEWNSAGGQVADLRREGRRVNKSDREGAPGAPGVPPSQEDHLNRSGRTALSA